MKLLDFGLARTVSDQPYIFGMSETQAGPLTGAGMLVGSVGYMSPEQLSGSVVDARSDIFSLGIVLFEMLSGRLPFWRESAVETFTATLEEVPPAIADLRSGVPASLERIVMRCLEKSPAERFQSARDLAFALLALSVPSGDAAEAKMASRIVVPDRSRLDAAIAAIIGVSAVAIGAAYWATSTTDRHPLVTFTISRPPGTTLANVPSKMLASGRDEVYVRSFPDPNRKIRISTGGGASPRWASGGTGAVFPLGGGVGPWPCRSGRRIRCRWARRRRCLKPPLGWVPTGTLPRATDSTFS